jgi:urease accessory protein
MLRRLRSIAVATDVTRRGALSEKARTYRVETLTVGWEERQRTRARRRTDQGTEFATALPRGTVLRGEDCLVIDDQLLVVEILECAEPVLVVEPRTPREWALAGYSIGNSHQPVMLTGTTILCPDTPGMDEYLERSGILFTRAMMPFTPVALGAEVAGVHSVRG